LAKLGFEGMVALAARYTVARLLERDDFSKRHKEGIAIHVHELLYPLLQGWDSVMVRADVELGGTDQLFNLLVGRDLQEQEGQEPQVCLTTPLLIGLDGQQKMSKSYGNTVGITEPASEMAIKVMRLGDALMRDWFLLVTRLPEAEIDRILAPGRNPRDAKLDLARTIAGMYHGPADAEAAVAGWLRVVSEHALPENIPELRLAPSFTASTAAPEPTALDYVMATGWTASKSEARRWITEGSVRFDDEKVTDPKAAIPFRAGIIVRHGKQHIAKTAASS
jgi:tyrosyl-tRNA synthetase